MPRAGPWPARLRPRRRTPGPPTRRPLRDVAAEQGVRATPDDRRLLDELDRLLEPLDMVPGRRASVAVLGRPADDSLARLLTAARPRARVLAVDGTQDPRRLHLALAARGRFDLLVDDTGPDIDRGELLRRVFLHLRRGGALVVRDPGTGAGPAPADLVPSLARAVGTVSQAGGHLVVTSRSQALAVVREEEVNGLLQARRPPRGELLATVPATRFRSRAGFGDSPGAPRGAPAEFDVPELSLRRYDDVRCFRGQVVVQGNLMLPDSFRKGRRTRLHNTFVADRGPGFAVPKRPHRPGAPGGRAPALDGSYFHLDCEFRGHFGHAMTDQLSRLWAWQQARQADPELRALLVRNRQRELHDFEVALFGALGVPAQDLVLVDGPVRVERLYAATPMFDQPRYVHPGIAAVWDQAGERLAAAAPQGAYPDRIFVSRRSAKRACHNSAEVEKLFAGHGFEVVFPEDYPLAEQARMFREAAVVGGFAGSGMFGTLFSPSPQRVILVSSDSYLARNEHLIAGVRGHHVDTAWCRADVPHPPRGWTWEAFWSDFTFDHDREGAWLAGLLDRL